MKFYNNNPEFGYSGPFEADNEDELLEMMLPQIRIWAQEIVNAEENEDEGIDIDAVIEQLGDEFLAGLEELPEVEADTFCLVQNLYGETVCDCDSIISCADEADAYEKQKTVNGNWCVCIVSGDGLLTPHGA